MSFLSPLFFAALSAIAIPIFVHLIQREKKRVIEFPSLMFVQKIPYQSVRRRRIRHWFLLLMRAAAIALIVAAFARPFLPKAAAATAAITGGSREVVIMLDQSASMGYGDHWKKAVAAALSAIGDVNGSDKATLVLFGRNAEESVRATSDHGRLEAGLASAKVTSGATRYGPALKLAESILARSALPRREAILISDFQKTGWSGTDDVHFSEGVKLTPISVADPKAANISVPSVQLPRSTFSGRERVTITAGVANKSAEAASNVPVSLEMDGQQIEKQTVNVAANASASVTFQPVTLAEAGVHGVVHAGADSLPADNTFHFVLSPSQAVSVLVVDGGAADSPSLYLSKALAIGTAPEFREETLPVSRLTSDALEKRSVVVLNDVALPASLAGGVLRRYVERGGGLLVVFGEHTSWPASEADILPGTIGGFVDRINGHAGTIGYHDTSHPVFDVFKAPRSGDFAAPHIYRYRALTPSADARVLARYDDGAVASAEKRVGTGRVIAWTTSLDDSWNDLAKRPVYLPLVQRMAMYLARYEQPTSWSTVGQVVDLSAWLKSKADRVVITPSGERMNIRSTEPGIVELNEQGVYEVRSSSNTSGRPDRIAVNLEPSESDLAPLDPTELVAAVTGHATQTADPSANSSQVPPEEAEKSQSIWWYLMFAGLLLLAAESVVANRLSRQEKFL
jgi:hypothetical protein